MKVKDLVEVFDFESSDVEAVKVTSLVDGELYSCTIKECEGCPMTERVNSYYGEYKVLEFWVGNYGGTTLFLTVKEVTDA